MKFLESFRNFRYLQYIAAITACLSLASTSSYNSWLSPSLPKLTSEDSPIGTTLTLAEASWVASSVLLGNVAGSFAAGLLVEKFGRKWSLILAAVPLFIPWIVITFARSALVVIVARFVAGIGGAIALTAAPMYIGEIAAKDIRGKLGLSCNLLMNAANFFVLCVGPFVSYTAITLSCGIFPLLLLIFFFFMPESPYYLIKTGKKMSAKESLVRFSANKDDQKTINEELTEIETTVRFDMENKSTLWEFLSKKNYRRSLFVMIGVKALQMLSGLIAIEAHMQAIVDSSGSSISPEKSSIIFGFIEILAVLISATLVDRMGRKPLLTFSALGCALALIAEGMYFYLQDEVHANVENLSWLPTTCLALYLVMNHIGVYSLPFVLDGELFATNIKGVAVSVFLIYSAALAFLVTKFYDPVSEAWGIYITFWTFAGFCILGALFVVFMLPETNGKSFAEIQGKLNKNRTFQSDVVSQF